MSNDEDRVLDDKATRDLVEDSSKSTEKLSRRRIDWLSEDDLKVLEESHRRFREHPELWSSYPDLP